MISSVKCFVFGALYFCPANFGKIYLATPKSILPIKVALHPCVCATTSPRQYFLSANKPLQADACLLVCIPPKMGKQATTKFRIST